MHRALVQTQIESWEGAERGEYVPVLPPAGYVELWGWEVSALSAPHCPGGRCGAAARPAGAAETDAPGEDRVAAGPRGQVRGRGEACGGGGGPLSLASGMTGHSLPRNTKNFQQLLWSPGTEKPAPGE